MCRSTLAALRSFFPFFSVLRYYSLRRDLLRDVVVGLTVCVMQIPQGMAYGLLAGLDPVFGLYVSLLPVLVYFFLGTSKHISVGALRRARLALLASPLCLYNVRIQ